MSQTTYIAPVETFTGKISSHNADGRITVSRRKCFGKDAKGRPIYGPGETYVYHRHEGKWSEAATNNRLLFQQVQTLAKHELSDPDRLAYWQPLFERQFKRPKPNQKRYTTLRRTRNLQQTRCKRFCKPAIPNRYSCTYGWCCA